MAQSDRSDRIFVIVGATLLVGYVAQGIAGVQWPLLARAQANETYKVASGCVLAIYLLHQAFMARRRVFDPIGVVYWHKLAGALAPLVLYAHASKFGYGYLLLLASLFVVTIACGLLHRVAVRARWLFTTWFVVHVATSASLVVLSGYHVVIALAYE